MIRLNVSESRARLRVRQERPSLTAQDAVVVTTGGFPYEGAYEVTPTVDGFTLPTAKKVMREDLTVKQIPIFETGNTSGGSTVYIAADINE